MTARCHHYRGLLAISHNSLTVPKAWHLACQWHPAPQPHSRPVEALIKPRLLRYLSSEPHSEVHQQSDDTVGSFRHIQFPNSWKGRRAERKAHELWASYWRTVPQIHNPLSFKIDDGNQSSPPGIPSVTREGIVFAKGDNQGERYWRLSHPISLIARLRRVRSGIREITWSNLLTKFRQWLYTLPSKPLAFRRWLYGGPSLPLSAKLQWLITGPSKQPWKRRSRWVRWPVAWLGVFLIFTAVLVAFELEPAPFTERSRFTPAAARVRLDEVTREERDDAEAILHKKFKKLRTPNLREKARLGPVFSRLLLACGLGNTRWRLFIVDNPGKYPR